MQENSSISNFKLVIKIIIFCACILGILKYAGSIYEKAAENNVVNYFTKARYDEFYSLEKNSLDMAFIGSSHSYCTFDPNNFDSELNIKSHQFGTPLQHPDTSYYVLKEILNYQKPKVVVLEVYWDVLDDEFEMKQANSFFEVLNNEELYNEYIKEVFPLSEKVKYNILPIRYQQDYFAYESNEMQKKLEDQYDISKNQTEQPKGIEEYRSKGYVYCDIVLPKEEYDETNHFKEFNGKDWEFNKTQKMYLNKIIELCKTENIELIFVTAPVANVSMDYIKNYDVVNNEISEFAKKNGIKYIDYNIINKEEQLLTNEHFRDDAHLNDNGVKVVNKHFLNWLKNNLDTLK